METKITPLINQESILLDLEAKDYEDLFKQVCEKLGSSVVGNKGDKEKLIEALKQRESMGSTAVGNGIALPHARIDGIKSLSLCLVRLKNAIDFKAIDKKDCDLFFFLLAPGKEVGKYLKSLSKLSKLLKESDFAEDLRKAKDSKAALEQISSRD